MAENASGPGAIRAAVAMDRTICERENSTSPPIGKLSAALAYAQLDWHVLPLWWIEDNRRCACPERTSLDDPKGKCKPGKHPFGRFVPNGVKNATTSEALIRRWYDREPRINLAVATGPKSGILVLDVDGPEGERCLLEVERRHDPLPICTLQWTGGGRAGWQAFFAYPEGRQIGNSAGRLGPKLDTRGEGGYALVGPSVTAERYRWATDRDPWTLPPEPAPVWLLDLLDPPPKPTPASWQPSTSKPSQDRYILRALESELALIASASSGRRNDQLNESAFALFRFVLEDRLSADAIVHGLEAAGRHAGLTDREITLTISSAAKARGISL